MNSNDRAAIQLEVNSSQRVYAAHRAGRVTRRPLCATKLAANNAEYPALAAGRHVLCDRFTDSTLAYQGAEGVDRLWVLEASAGIAVPDLTVYLEVPDRGLLEKADPITRQLLGGYMDVDTQPWALQRWAKRHGVQPEPVPWTVEV